MFKINGMPVEVNNYPDGTLRINVNVGNPDGAHIEWLYKAGEEMALLFIVNHLRERLNIQRFTLDMPYIPNARMDRVKTQNEVFTLKYFCEFVNSLGFDKVFVRDAHSPVSLALINNVVCEDIGEAIKELQFKLLNPNKDIVFFPDEGSCKRYFELAKYSYAFGIKKRDWATGEIIGLDVHGAGMNGELPTSPFNVLIIDDISSYGGTFFHSAKKLKELGADKIYLYVTHCENSILDGELINSGLLEKIYTTKSIFTGEHPLIEVINNEGDQL